MEIGERYCWKKDTYPEGYGCVVALQNNLCTQTNWGVPPPMLQYAPDRVIAETCNICYRALRDPDVYFTAAQRKRLQKMKGIISTLAYKRLPMNVKRNIIQRGGFDFASILRSALPIVTKVVDVGKDMAMDALMGL